MDSDQIREAVLSCFEDEQSLTHWWSSVCMKHMTCGKLTEWVGPEEFIFAVKILIARGRVYPEGEEDQRIFCAVIGHPKESAEWFRTIGRWLNKEMLTLRRPSQATEIDSELEAEPDDSSSSSIEPDKTPLFEEPTDVVDGNLM